jgi:two-component system, NtrC family, sensor histidine kinase PilS
MTPLWYDGPEAAPPHGRGAWRSLHALNLYRLTLSGLFLALSMTASEPTVLGQTDPELFRAASAFYLLFAFLCGLMIRSRWPDFRTQVYTHVFADVLAITILMHASGGVGSGMGMLLLIAVATGSLLMGGRMAALFAAVAALAVLGQQGYMHLLRPGLASAAYMQAGLLGAAFFATALLAHALARQLRESEALAEQRGVDLANLAQLNETIIQRMDVGVIVVDAEQHVRLMNGAARSLLGAPAHADGEDIGRICPALRAQLVHWDGTRRYEPRRFRPKANGPELLPRFNRLGPQENSGTLVFLEDTAAMAQQVQQMKLAALGRLTASIAHEVRNPLGAISHAGQLLAESPALDDADRRLTEIIRDHSQRVNTIVENVLQLSRREASKPEVLALRPWLEAFVRELRESEGLAPGRIAVTIQPLDAEVRIDPSHLHQVLWNLCQNGLRHGRIDDKPAQLALHGGVMPELPGVYLDVIDSGPGVPPALAEQVFEPFFTTQAQGTGLGLYIARELCECNQARLAYLPAPSGGSCFRIHFAAADGLALEGLEPGYEEPSLPPERGSLPALAS